MIIGFQFCHQVLFLSEHRDSFLEGRMVCACRFQCTLCIADNVGDNVGDIAGVGADLFGSFAEATSCAALFPVCSAALFLVASAPQLMTSWTALMYPVLISSLGIVVCVLTPILRKFIYPLHEDFGAVGTISVVFMSPVVVVLSWMSLPDEFTMSTTITEVRWWCCALAILLGLWSGLLIGFVTEYYTSNTFVLVREIVEMLRTCFLASLTLNGMPVVRMSLKEPVLASCASAETSDPF